MSQEEMEEEIIEVDFEGVEAQDCDLPSMSRLLTQLLRESGVSPDELAKVLVSQNYVGNVLKACLYDADIEAGEDPDDQPVYAITSMINLTSRQEPVIQDIIRFIRKCIRDEKLKVEKGSDIFEQIINESGMLGGMSLGLLVKERMVNLPFDMLTTSLQSLRIELMEASAKKMPYKFTHMMYWSKLYSDEGKTTHFDIEDSWFDENSIDYFSYPLKNADTVMVESNSSSPGATPIRRVYVLEYSKLDTFIQYVKDLIGAPKY